MRMPTKAAAMAAAETRLRWNTGLLESVGWFLSSKPQAECPIYFRQFLWVFTPVRRTLLEHEGLSITSVLFAIDASYEGLERTLLFLVSNR